ncbi:MAG TPA: hypothetical protein VMZ73_06390 [Acidimicrobiales bacterium]|nr:hypothetical protein [Acidimicrobiales bacterium]
MLILSVLAGWTLLSVPVGLVVGRLMRGAGAGAGAGEAPVEWSHSDSRQLEVWTHHHRLGA